MAYKKPEEKNQPIDWAQTASDLYGQIANRQKFQYDVDQDALYQSYRDQYARNGQRAMTDTMGQAAALTGGYGSTYAQAVGQQQYNDYMTKLNAEVPNLYAQARAAYDKQTDDLYNRYNLAYGMSRDALADERYQKEWDYNVGRDAIADQRYQQEWEANQAYQKWQMDRTNQQDARDYALMMIKMGKMPSADALAATGWNTDDVKAMVSYYANQLSAASYSGGSGSGGRYYSGGGSNDNATEFDPKASDRSDAFKNVYNAILMTGQTGNSNYAYNALEQYAGSLSDAEAQYAQAMLEDILGRIDKTRQNQHSSDSGNSGTGGGRRTRETATRK